MLPSPNNSIRELSGGLAWLAHLRRCRDGQKHPGQLKAVLNEKNASFMPNLQTLRKILQQWVTQTLLTNF
jgi:hypothetical protein